MFTNPQPVNPEQHGQLKLSTTPDYRYCAREIVTPFVSGEMWQIAREFITVFPLPGAEGGLPLALLGNEAGVNAYVGEGTAASPAWWGRYVPAHLRRYPFVLAPRAAEAGDAPDQQRFTLCLDTDAPQLGTVQGRPLFTHDGQSAELLREVQQALMGLQRDLGLTQALVRQIDAAGLLVEHALQLPRAGRQPIAFSGFRMVDQARLRASAPELLAALARTGALDLVYAHIGSLTNVQDGLLAKKEAPRAAGVDFQGMDIDALLSSHGGTIKLNS